MQSSYERATAVFLVAAPLIHIVNAKDVCNEVVIIIKVFHIEFINNRDRFIKVWIFIVILIDFLVIDPEQTPKLFCSQCS